jgi:hypothetical protein
MAELACELSLPIHEHANGSFSEFWERIERIVTVQGLGMDQAPEADEALTEAIDAHLILLASHQARLQTWQRSWLERWAVCRKIKNAALAMISDQNGEALLMSATSELFLFAVRHGLEFILNTENAAEDRWTFFSRSFPKGEQLPPLVQRHFPEVSEVSGHRHWGINE